MLRAPFLPGRKTVVLLLLVAIAIGGAAWWTCGPRDPIYEGRRLSAWLYENHKAQFTPGRFTIQIGGQQRVVYNAGTGAVSFAPSSAMLKSLGPDAIVWLGYAVEHGQLSLAVDRQTFARFPRTPPPQRSVAAERMRELARKWLRLRLDDTYDECLNASMVLQGLGEGAAPAIPALLRALGAADTRRADAAWRVLSAIGAPARLPLRNALLDGSKMTRRRIAHELPYAPWYVGRTLPEAERAGNLQAALKACENADAEVRGWAAVTVAECCAGWGYDPAMEVAIRVLIAQLSAPDGQHRACAASYLPLFGAPARAATPRLVELLDDSEAKVRMEAVKALAKLDGEEGHFMARLRQMRSDPDASVRDSVALHLGRFGAASE